MVVPVQKHVKMQTFPDDGFKPSKDDEKEDNDGLDDQEKEEDVNSTNIVNVVSTNEVNAAGANPSMKLPDDPNMPLLEEIVYSEDDEDVGAEADITNLDSHILVGPISTTRIHKDHPLDQVIRDVHSITQTRRMSKKMDEHGLAARMQEGIKHKDYQNYRFAC
ncbi:hypothetical protein Tco_0202777, partial [Tanacetum coccineum]